MLTCLNKQANNIKHTQKYEMQMWIPQAPHSFNFPPQEVTTVNILICLHPDIFLCLNAKHELSLLDTEEVSRTIVCPECKVSNASRLHGVVCVCELLSPVCLFGTPWDCIPSGSSVHGLLQARTLEWVAAVLSRQSYQTQGLNLGVSSCRWILYSLSHQGSPCRVANKA